MTADKRTPHTDALDTLGAAIDETAKRDAIHLAVEPAMAAHFLEPGDHVTLREGRAYRAAVGAGLGIVDPFLAAPLAEGQRFWMVVYPRTITSLRHVWEHPALPETAVPAASKDASERYLRNFADAHGIDYFVLVGAASGGPDYGDDYITIRDHEIHADIPPEFWDHMEVVTGRKIPPTDRASHFSCSC